MLLDLVSVGAAEDVDLRGQQSQCGELSAVVCARGTLAALASAVLSLAC